MQRLIIPKARITRHTLSSTKLERVYYLYYNELDPEYSEKPKKN